MRRRTFVQARRSSTRCAAAFLRLGIVGLDPEEEWEQITYTTWRRPPQSGARRRRRDQNTVGTSLRDNEDYFCGAGFAVGRRVVREKK